MKVAAYARFSSDNQREESIDAQLRAIRKYCKDNNYNIVKIYIDQAFSARTDQRPDFQKMIQESKQGQFEAVIVHKFDRFTRNRYDSVKYKHLLKQQGVRVISVLEHLEDTPESVLMESLYEGLAEYYSLNLARETMKGLKENAQKCMTTGGTPPLGFDVENKKYVINHYEAQAVKIIFNMYADDKSYTQIIDELNARGYKTKRNQPFGKNSIHDILMNEKYIGNYIYNVRNSAINGKRNNSSRKPEDEIIRKENVLPRIIDDITWNKVRLKMKERKHPKTRAKNKATDKYLLSGKLYCACGSKMHGNRRGNGNTKGYVYSSYNCSNKDCKAKGIEKNKIESLVLSELKKYFTPEVKEKLYKEMQRQFTETKTNASSNIQAYENELKKIDIEIENMIDAVAKGFYRPEMKVRSKELDNKKIELNSLLEQAQFYTLPTQEQFNEYLNLVLQFDNPDNNQRVIDTFVDTVVVYESDITINIKVESGIKSVGTTGAEEGSRTLTPVKHTHLKRTCLPFHHLCKYQMRKTLRKYLVMITLNQDFVKYNFFI